MMNYLHEVPCGACPESLELVPQAEHRKRKKSRPCLGLYIALEEIGTPTFTFKRKRADSELAADGDMQDITNQLRSLRNTDVTHFNTASR
jgi:hypothetical protein